MEISLYSNTCLINADCNKYMQYMPDQSIDLIITSSPYADQREKTYGGISPDKYVEWFIPITKEFKRILKPSGTFILNIKEKAINGERHTYVLELILNMRMNGWLWTEEFIWHKKKVYPDNVLYLATECSNRNHSASFPETLPEWLIKLFTDPGDWVVDPFLGSGTICAVARKLKRNSVGY